MNRMVSHLKKLSENNKSIDFSVVGIGKMGKGLLNQISRIPAMRSLVICDENLDVAIEGIESTGLSKNEYIVTEKKEEAIKEIENGKMIVTTDWTLAVEIPQIQGVVDCTGNPPFGAILAEGAIENKKHMINLNVESDAVIGPILYKKAKEKGVVYTGSSGDEPGAIIELADFAKAIGFKILAVGKGKNNPLNVQATEDDLKEEALSKGLYPKILTSFVDGTNTMLELTCVANSIGFVPDQLGGHGITTNLKSITKDFSLKEEGGILNQYGIVDYVFGMAPGVFVIVTHDAKEVHDLMHYVSMGEGPNYVLYRPFHLTSLETPISIFKAIVENTATISPQKGQIADTITVAKRDLKAGKKLEGIGGKDVYGQIIDYKTQQEKNYLPIGLITKETKLKKDIKKGDLLTYDDVLLEKVRIVELREEQDLLMKEW